MIPGTVMIRGIRRPIRLKEGDGTSPEASSKRFEYELDIIDPLVMYKPLTSKPSSRENTLVSLCKYREKKLQSNQKSH